MYRINNISLTALFIFSIVFGSMVIRPIIESLELFQNSDHTWVEYALDENSSEQENSDEKDAENENEEIYFLNVMSSMSLYTHKQNTFIEQHAFFDIVLKTYFPPPEIS